MKNIDFEKLKNVLPKKPGILRKKEYFNAAVLIPLVLYNEEYYFLFEKRGAKIRQGSEICFPGGEYDPDSDKSLLETAIRETIEELGIKRGKIKVIGKVDILVGNMGVTVDPFLSVIKINNIEELKLDRDEVEKIFLLPVSYFYETPPETYYLKLEVHPYYTTMNGEKIDLFPAKELDLPERYLAPWTAGKHKVYAWRTKEGTIWGMTAALIYEVINKIKLSEEG
ncbi:MAG: CoA pyrophosphatase [Ignavibacteriaceae bacterium]|nr:CoA pyrophosphatase [Ignavibacteriaceae bacterium]